ncbi:MAG: nucleotide exchange factor GrpE [Planctomycetota bacterium]|nr:nucleotide exchange factor GrpE [Planctomycetota bacterium]
MVMPQSDQPDADEREEGLPPVAESETEAGEEVSPAADSTPGTETENDGAVDGTEETPEPDIHEQLEEAQQRALRHQAELENFRKRMRREMEDQQRYSGIPLIRDLLPALDNLRRAVESAEPTEANDGVLSGVRMVCEQFEGILAKYQCCRIESEGAVFDPNLHEAVVQQPSAEHEAGTVIQEIQAGYRLLDRIVRPSQVMVAQSVEEPSEDKPGTPENEET